MDKVLKTISGYEVLSNDRKIKIILHETTVMSGAMETELYIAHYYVKEGTEWFKTNTAHSYESERDFISSICQTDAFSEAISELRETLSEELSDDRPHGRNSPCHYADDR